MPYGGSYTADVRGRAWPGILTALLLAAGLLLPSPAAASHNREMAAASGESDAAGPEVFSAEHGRRLFFGARKRTSYYFRVEHDQETDVTIKVVKPRSGKVVRRWRRRDVADGEVRRVRWNGLVRRELQRQRRYAFRLVARDEDGDTSRSAADGDLRDAFNLWHHRFPVAGRHQYGDGFGAGRGHQGTDVFAACGTRLRAARGGRVQYSGYHSSAGYYTVIDGRKTGEDYAYMHLQNRPRFREGERVKTGQTIGRVGETGNASGCHLHFEMWSAPGWYEGGSAMDSEPHLRSWDSFS